MNNQANVNYGMDLNAAGAMGQRNSQLPGTINQRPVSADMNDALVQLDKIHQLVGEVADRVRGHRPALVVGSGIESTPQPTNIADTARAVRQRTDSLTDKLAELLSIL